MRVCGEVVGWSAGEIDRNGTRYYRRVFLIEAGGFGDFWAEADAAGLPKIGEPYKTGLGETDSAAVVVRRHTVRMQDSLYRVTVLYSSGLPVVAEVTPDILRQLLGGGTDGASVRFDGEGGWSEN